MADRTLDGLRACVASLNTVVAPAVERSGDKLAREQTALIGKYLAFLTARLDCAESRSRAELARHADMAAAVAGLLAAHGQRDDGVETALANAHAMLAQASAAKPALETATAGLQAALSRVVRAAGEQAHPLCPQIDRAVLQGSRAVVTLQRAWFAPQGWEAAGDAPDIDDALLAGGVPNDPA